MRAQGEKGKKVTKNILLLKQKITILLSPKPPRGLLFFMFKGMFGRALTSVPCGLMGRKWWRNQEGKKKVNPLERGWGWTTFLWGVKIFYFSLFLEIASCTFVCTKVDLPSLLGDGRNSRKWTLRGIRLPHLKNDTWVQAIFRGCIHQTISVKGRSLIRTFPKPPAQLSTMGKETSMQAFLSPWKAHNYLCSYSGLYLPRKKPGEP